MSLLSFMRPERKFDSIDLLRTRIHLDGWKRRGSQANGNLLGCHRRKRP